MLLLIFLFGSTFQFFHPSFMASSQQQYFQLRRLKNVNKLLFDEPNTKGFISEIQDMPKKIIIFSIQTDLNPIDLTNHIKDNINKLPNIQKIFGTKEYGYISNFIMFDDKKIHQEFQDEVLKRQSIYKYKSHTTEMLNFEQQHENLLLADTPSIEKISMPTNISLQYLDKLIQNDIKKLKENDYTYFMLILFRQDQNRILEQRLDKVQKVQKVLLEKIRLSPSGMTGILITFLFSIITTIGIICMKSIQTPKEFQKRSFFYVGKET